MRSTGVSLLELLVALAVVALVVAVAAPSFVGALQRAQLDGAAREMVVALRTARHHARQSRREQVLMLDTVSHEYWLVGQQHTLRTPPGTGVTMVIADSELTGATKGSIRFFGDGSSTGGRITLDHGDRRRVVVVDWLTGAVSIGG